MYAAKEDTLSSDELRKRLYQTFKNKGVLNTLKTQMRNQLIQELKHPPLAAGEPVPRPVSVQSEPLLVSACNSIVAEHLSTSGYEYTLSVFYPESGLCKEKVSTKEELLRLLKIHPSSSLYRSLASNKDSNDKGFLIRLLTQLTQHYTPDLYHDAETQTTSIATYGESLVQKMKMIDKEYENFSHSGDKWLSFQSQLSAYRKEMAAQLEAEMNTKLQHFKDVEIAKVRMEEKSTFNQEFVKLKQELERTYERKTKALVDREKNAIDRLQKQQEIEERNVYNQRQSVLKEMETLRSRENDLRMRVEGFEKTCQVHKEKVETTEELLRRRDLALKTTEDTYEQRLKNELSRYQLELKEEFIRRTEKLTEDENQNKVETARIQREAAVIDSKLEEHSRACSELQKLQVELDTTQQQMSLMTQRQELLQGQLETMSDYTSLKREKAELQGQLRLLKKQLDEAREENRLLYADLGKPSKEQLALQMELRRLQSARRLEEEGFDNQKQVLQTQLQREVELCAQLKAQLIECEQKSQWMTNHVEDLKMQLHQTQKAGGPLHGHRSLWNDSSDSENELVVKAMARFQELQREAETLEEAYRNYQQRAVHSSISHMLPRRLSPQQPQPSQRPSSPPRKRFSHQSHTHSPHKPLSSQIIRTPSSSSCDTRNTVPRSQPRVTFSEAPNQLKAAVFTEHSVHSCSEPLILSDGHPLDESLTSFRRLSSTPRASPRKNRQKEIEEEAVVTPVPFSELPPDRQLPPSPRKEMVTSGDFSSEFSPPLSPQLKSTARDQPSPPKIQPVLTSCESSPEPDRISLEDLTGVLSEPGHIPELLLDTAIPLTEEAPDGPTVPHSQDLPEDPTDLQDQADVSQTTGGSVSEEDKEEEHAEQEEKDKEDEEEAATEIRIHEGDDEDDIKEYKGEDPLEKYMKMVLEAREKQHAQSHVGEETGHTSPEDKSMSEGKDDSFAAYLPKDEDDDFW
ncbi:centriole and centriolar satellite protein ofd1 isoform X2 [Solea solea]|uniref:centriole and centriolar satellite protein ofd1 isoform X2 n=1 Tax=Solea solea TaxID=90069 RepID=UPI00272CD677|nr:centriole and centriolar satellite protein ofd1 isoform X2 [Solea solea]